jgi:hypothetical protein
MSITPVLGSAAEAASACLAQVAFTDGAAAVASTACKRIGRNARASHRYGGNEDRDSVQHKGLHGSFLSG